MLATRHCLYFEQHAARAHDVLLYLNVRRPQGLGSSAAVMVRIPVLGRLFWYVLHYCLLPNRPLTKPYRREYIALAASLILIFLEGLIRVITLGLRKVLAHGFIVQLSNVFQPNQSFDSATTDPRTSST